MTVTPVACTLCPEAWGISPPSCRGLCWHGLDDLQSPGNCLGVEVLWEPQESRVETGPQPAGGPVHCSSCQMTERRRRSVSFSACESLLHSYPTFRCDFWFITHHLHIIQSSPSYQRGQIYWVFALKQMISLLMLNNLKANSNTCGKIIKLLYSCAIFTYFTWMHQLPYTCLRN